MALGYQRLRELVDARHDDPFLLAPDRDVLLAPRSYTRRHGRSWEVWRFDRNELATAVEAESATPVVYERFRLTEDMPVVRHTFDAMAVENDRLRPNWGQPTTRRQAWRAAARVARLSGRTGLDIASEDEIADLIIQLQHAEP